MSEVIETYIRSNPNLSQADSFEGFLTQERIRAWVGADATRKDRLSREFAKVWTDLGLGAPKPAAPSSTSARAGPAMQQAHTIQAPPRPREPEPLVRQAPPQKFPVIAPAEPAPLAVPVARRLPGAGTRKLDLLCSECGQIDVWNDEGLISCRACGRAYDNMLSLIPVQRVGAFEYVFGDGAAGWIAAGGVVVLIAGLYLLVKFLG